MKLSSWGSDKNLILSKYIESTISNCLGKVKLLTDWNCILLKLMRSQFIWMDSMRVKSLSNCSAHAQPLKQCYLIFHKFPPQKWARLLNDIFSKPTKPTQKGPPFSSAGLTDCTYDVTYVTSHKISNSGHVRYLEDHPRIRKWLGSPQFTSHKNATWNGSHNPCLGDLLSLVITHLQVMGWSSK